LSPGLFTNFIGNLKVYDSGIQRTFFGFFGFFRIQPSIGLVSSKKIQVIPYIQMIELILLILITVPLVVISYRVGRKNKKSDMTTVALLVLGAVFSSIIMYVLLMCDIISYFTYTGTDEGVTAFDY
jgi:hypothetical protein